MLDSASIRFAEKPVLREGRPTGEVEISAGVRLDVVARISPWGPSKLADMRAYTRERLRAEIWEHLYGDLRLLITELSAIARCGGCASDRADQLSRQLHELLQLHGPSA